MRFLLGLFFLNSLGVFSQFKGQVVSENETPIAGATVYNKTKKRATLSDEKGWFEILDAAVKDQIIISYINYQPAIIELSDKKRNQVPFQVMLEPDKELQEVVVTGTLKQVNKLDSPIPVELYRASFFKANPTASVFEAVQQINGIRPQLNCNVCNTGDIHINGQEGANTMVLIDGLPIVSGLSTVYGLSGIPQSLIEKVEVIKGPASNLYGSEAIGGVINLITKLPENSPIWSLESFSTSWGEVNTDIGLQYKIGETKALLGINHFNYSNPIDQNKDNFTDLTLQHRVSIFNKFSSPKNTLGIRLFYEDRWGGEMNWSPNYRGGNERYGESIYTQRIEFFGKYNLNSDWFLQYSFNNHNQNSVYGQTSFLADQRVAFIQSVWSKNSPKHALLYGISFRSTFYDDNTVATVDQNLTHLPGVFFQNKWSFQKRKKLLLGLRYDYNSLYGSIITPRVNFKWDNPEQVASFRLSWGTGYRIVNVFTEDHAALTGGREVLFEETLRPEKSWNINANWFQKVYAKQGYLLELDGSLFHTQFSNKIIPDYETNPNQIRYGNLDQKASFSGFTLNVNGVFSSGFQFVVGATLIHTNWTDEGIKKQPLLTERFTANYKLSYRLANLPLTLDWTGLIVGPMRLPLLGDRDPRPAKSPWIHDSNLQFRWISSSKIEIFGGIKNLVNFKPPRESIARAFDPFDRDVDFDANARVIQTGSNPNALSFDPSYVFYSNQGRRFFLGVRYALR
mgnify:CR=1 FL=1